MSYTQSLTQYWFKKYWVYYIFTIHRNTRALLKTQKFIKKVFHPYTFRELLLECFSKPSKLGNRLSNSELGTCWVQQFGFARQLALTVSGHTRRRQRLRHGRRAVKVRRSAALSDQFLWYPSPPMVSHCSHF